MSGAAGGRPISPDSIPEKTSLRAKRPMRTGMKEKPSYSRRTSKVYRLTPLRGSRPIVFSSSPSRRPPTIWAMIRPASSRMGAAAITSKPRDSSRKSDGAAIGVSRTVNAARLAVAAPWIVLLLMSSQPAAVRAYDTTEGAAVLLGGLAVSVAAYRLMLRLGALPEPRRVLR